MAELEPGTVTVSGCGEGVVAAEPEPGEPGAPGTPALYGEICGPADGLDAPGVPAGAGEVAGADGPDGAPGDPMPDIEIVSVPVKPE